jgi:hypothetical protein
VFIVVSDATFSKNFQCADGMGWPAFFMGSHVGGLLAAVWRIEHATHALEKLDSIGVHGLIDIIAILAPAPSSIVFIGTYQYSWTICVHAGCLSRTSSVVVVCFRGMQCHCFGGSAMCRACVPNRRIPKGR